MRVRTDLLHSTRTAPVRRTDLHMRHASTHPVSVTHTFTSSREQFMYSCTRRRSHAHQLHTTCLHVPTVPSGCPFARGPNPPPHRRRGSRRQRDPRGAQGARPPVPSRRERGRGPGSRSAPPSGFDRVRQNRPVACSSSLGVTTTPARCRTRRAAPPISSPSSRSARTRPHGGKKSRRSTRRRRP